MQECKTTYVPPQLKVRHGVFPACPAWTGMLPRCDVSSCCHAVMLSHAVTAPSSGSTHRQQVLQLVL